jgi:hypothetical protein
MGPSYSSNSESDLSCVVARLIPFSPPLPAKWSESNSMDTLKNHFATLLPRQKSTLGRLDADDGTTTDIQSNIYHTAVRLLDSTRLCWKRHQWGTFNQWDGLYVLDRIQKFRVSDLEDPSGKTPFEECWDYVADPLSRYVFPGSVFPGEVLSRLPKEIRSELESLPADLSSWSVDRSPPYCGGIGGWYRYSRRTTGD